MFKDVSNAIQIHLRYKRGGEQDIYNVPLQ